MNRVIILSFGLLALTACRSEQEKPAEPLAVHVVRPEQFTQHGLQGFDFISEPYRTTELSFRVGGPVRKLDLECGQFLSKGSLIAEIDPRDYQTALQKAEANRNQKSAEFKRMTNLYHKNNVSASSYEQAKADLETAEANYREALHNLQDTRMTAPTDGYVQEIMVERFADVAPTQPVLTFIDLSQIKMSVSISEEMALALRNQKGAGLCCFPLPVQRGRYEYPLHDGTAESTEFLSSEKPPLVCMVGCCGCPLHVAHQLRADGYRQTDDRTAASLPHPARRTEHAVAGVAHRDGHHSSFHE